MTPYEWVQTALSIFLAGVICVVGIRIWREWR